MTHGTTEAAGQAKQAGGNSATVSQEATMAAFSVGAVVVNFGAVARVVAVDPLRGLLLEALPGQGFGRRSNRWHADPAKCRAAVDVATVEVVGR